MDSNGVERPFEFSPAIYVVNRILPARWLVSYVGGDLFVHVLYVRYVVGVVSFSFVNEARETESMAVLCSSFTGTRTLRQDLE